MTCVAFRELEQVTVELEEVVFGEVDRVRALEHRSHDRRIARHFLLVARGEGPHVHVREQSLDLRIAQLRAFDSGRGSDALDGRYMTKGRETLRGDPTDGPPGALELVDCRNRRQDCRGDLQRLGANRGTRFSIRFHPISVSCSHPIFHPFPSNPGRRQSGAGGDGEVIAEPPPTERVRDRSRVRPSSRARFLRRSSRPKYAARAALRHPGPRRTATESGAGLGREQARGIVVRGPGGREPGMPYGGASR